MMENIFEDLFEINRTINRLFNTNSDLKRNYPYWPALNLYENNDENIIVVKLPGMKKEEISITIKDNAIKISGERKIAENGMHNMHIAERFKGKFERNFILHEKIDNDKIQAEFKNGLLIVKLPKSTEAKPKSITIN